MKSLKYGKFNAAYVIFLFAGALGILIYGFFTDDPITMLTAGFWYACAMFLDNGINRRITNSRLANLEFAQKYPSQAAHLYR